MKRMLTGIVLLAALTACSPYINIPAQPGDVATHGPNNGTVIRVMAAGLNAVLARREAPGPYAVALPAGTEAETYQAVLSRLPDGGVALEEDRAGRAVYSVAAVYVRGTSAQVDIVRRSTAGEPQLVSAYMKLGIDGWYVHRVRPWSIAPGEALDLAYPGQDID